VGARRRRAQPPARQAGVACEEEDTRGKKARKKGTRGGRGWHGGRLKVTDVLSKCHLWRRHTLRLNHLYLGLFLLFGGFRTAPTLE
jgi:hypothetical protein